MTEFCCMAFGGPHKFTGKSLTAVHTNPKSRGQKPRHFDQVMGFVEDILHELEVPPTEFHECMAILVACKNDVLGLGKLNKCDSYI